jgi:hypothetical protein
MWDLWWIKWHWGRFSPSTATYSIPATAPHYHQSSPGARSVDVPSGLTFTAPYEIRRGKDVMMLTTHKVAKESIPLGLMTSANMHRPLRTERVSHSANVSATGVCTLQRGSRQFGETPKVTVTCGCSRHEPTETCGSSRHEATETCGYSPHVATETCGSSDMRRRRHAVAPHTRRRRHAAAPHTWRWRHAASPDTSRQRHAAPPHTRLRRHAAPPIRGDGDMRPPDMRRRRHAAAPDTRRRRHAAHPDTRRRRSVQVNMQAGRLSQRLLR